MKDAVQQAITYASPAERDQKGLLTPLRAPAPSALAGAVELQQIYVLSKWHGQGVAAHLMEWALATAARDDAPEIYLTVFDHNERAKRFYRRYGFSEAARCTFTLGDRVDDDRVWRLSLRPEHRPVAGAFPG